MNDTTASSSTGDYLFIIGVVFALMIGMVLISGPSHSSYPQDEVENCYGYEC